MTMFRSARRWTAAPLVLAMTLGVTFGSAGPASANDEEEAFDTKIMRSILRGFGLRNGEEAGIEYRERSPLVLPPGRNLPSPETASAAAKNPQWPVDADVKRAREAKAERRRPRKSIEEESVPETPGQLDRVGRASRTPAGQAPAGSSRDPSNPSTLSELGAKSMFTWSGLWGQKEEYGTFTEEPVRESLTQPPVGYRTPSNAQPYGVGKDKWDPKATNPMDTPSMRGEN